MTAKHRSARTTALALACLALLIAVARPDISRAQDNNAHGQSGASNTNSADIHQPSAAVAAPRTSQRYTAPGMTLNPVAIDIDPNGNIYVVEGWRHGKGAVAVVNGPMWRSGALPLDLQRTTIEQRAEHIESLIERGFYTRAFFTEAADLVRKVSDTDGDGIADKAAVFAGRFNDKLEGVASGVLYHKGKLYFANVPHLWLLEDKDGDGDADKETPGERISMSYGYGLRWAYGGHDLHGLIKGPDGRIYFTMGDRGYNIQTKEGERLVSRNTGSVLRMWPDGSGLEVFATGLRNPQELAFDNYGNLFTGDNNCDAGDLARFCFIPEGSDTGWRQDVQTFESTGPWHREHIWKPRFDKNDPAQPAWIMPPLANVGRGPSGIAHYPGTGDAFPANGSFLMCDYPAGVRHVRVVPDGASFRVVEDSTFEVETQTISDLAWGYDGRLYLADWGEGWNPNDKGHLKVMVNEAAHKEQADVIAQVKSLFANGFDKLSDDELIALLGHQDQRVRMETQWELAERPDTVTKLGLILSLGTDPELKRLHALWALGMQARKDPLFTIQISFALDDKSSRIQAQALSLLGDLGEPQRATYNAMLGYESPIVQHHAAIALGKTGNASDIPKLLDLLERNDNNNVVLRNAASYALQLIGDAEAIHHESKRRGSAARLGAVLALRRLSSPLLVEYIEDKDTQVAAEAVRAIYDQRLDDQLPALAALLDTLPPERMIEPIMRRVIEANIRLADADSADRLAKLAANAEAPEMWRALALEELTQWSAPRDREGVWGAWWPRPTQPMDHASAAMAKYLPAIKASASAGVLTQARVFELTHVLKADKARLAELARNADDPDAVRLAGMQMLRDKDRAMTVTLAQELLAAPTSSPALRTELRAMVLDLDRDAAVVAYTHALDTATTPEQQDAIARLALIRTREATGTMSKLGQQLIDGTLAPELRMDAYTALSTYKNLPTDAQQAAAQYAREHTQPGEAPFIRDASLAGGSIERGKDIFFNNNTAQCQRCHTVGGKGSVGPDLAGIGARYDINQLYTAVVHPNATIAQGYASSAVTLKDGSIKTGRIDKDKSTPAQLVLINNDGVASTIQRQNINGIPITSKVSAMPTMNDKLKPEELRDVLAYLASLKQTTGSASGVGALAGPSLINPAKDIKHAVLLPMILMGIFVALGLLLLVTVLGGGTSHEQTPDAP